MSSIRVPLLSPAVRAGHHFFAAVLLVLMTLAGSARADMAAISQSVWKLKYAVSDAQINDLNWLAADDDKDGVPNGNELGAGTNPFAANSVVKISNLSVSGGSVTLSFPSAQGKNYCVQSTQTLGSPLSWTKVLDGSNQPYAIVGNGSTRTLTVPWIANTFYRVLVEELDTDGDGASNWAEIAAGYNPSVAMTNGTTLDGAALTAAIAASNIVTVTVTKPRATQPADSATAPVETGSITISRSGTLDFAPITVPLQKSGTAIESTDYDSLPSEVIFPANVTQVILSVNPKYNVNRKTNVTAIVKALPGGGYTVGSASAGSVVINPAGLTQGTGLTGNYHNASNANYTAQLGIFGGTAEMSRTDATVDFTNGVNGWGSATGPTGMSPAAAGGLYSVRWTGQILPQYSERYYIDFRSDDSAKVWVNGVLLIDRWTTQSATDYVNSIELTAGTLYDIQIDYWNSGGNSEARLYWWSDSQPKQIIPTNRLFPAPTLAQKVTAVTSSLEAIGYVGVPFSFSVVTPNIGGAITYAVAPNSGSLPPGLTLNASTGLISGTPTAQGSFNVAINATNTAAATVTGSSVVNFTIFPTGSVTRETLDSNGVHTGDGTVPTLDDDTDYGSGTTRRLRGYIVPPKTGNYYFWIAASNTAELWIANDSEAVNRILRASVGASSGKKVWNASPTQRSQWLALTQGERYYFDVIHNTGSEADDYVAVGWCQDDVGTIPSVVGDANPTGVAPQIANGGAVLQGYPLSGTVPGYIFQPYDYPTTDGVTGSLYAANLGPQGAAATKASGSATLRVAPDNNSAVLHFSYQGLTSPRTAYHLHVDAFDSHPAGEIIYDIDDIDSFHPELRTPDGGYIWNFATTGTFTTIQQIRDAITSGKVYLNIHSVNFGAGEIRGNLNLIDGSQTPPNPALYAEPSATDVNTNDAHAARFLNQATFGASPADVAYVKANGFSAWIDDQLTKPASRTSNEVVAGLTADINTPYPSTLFTNAWWKNSVTGSDQLRQRLAFALSEILVVSWANNTGPLQNNGRILADYYDNLVDYCLPTAGLAGSGNFRGILKAVTLTPAMGLYLDMRGNQKEDLTIGRHPNENYAREIMQLFSIGINRMWDDGKFVLNSDAGVVPTYTQPTILGLSKLLTGWNYAQPNQANGRLPTNFGPGSDFLNPMVLVPSRHDLNAKLLLDNVVAPAASGQTPRVSILNVTINASAPCDINTTTMHGLSVGDTVRIANVTGGTFSAPLNAMHVVTEVVDADTIRVGVICSVAPTSYTNAVVTGAKVSAGVNNTVANFNASGVVPVTGSQADSAGTGSAHPYDLYGLNELEFALDNIFKNDNVAPYICRQLIQRFVTSDPSPGYLYRVVQKWRNNGSGVRGDLAAVVRQILLDGEARSYSTTASNVAFGKQREPMLRVTGPARAFPAASYTGTYTQLTGINSNRLRVVTSAPNDFSAGFSVALDFRGNYTPQGAEPTPPNPANNPTSTTYGINATLGIQKTWTGVASIPVSSPALVTTTEPHGLATGNSIRITGTIGGTFSQNISTTSRTVTVIDATSFTINSVNCTVAATTPANGRLVSNPCKVTTVGPHGLSVNDSITISGISGGTFSPTINATFPVLSVVNATSFTIATDAQAPSTDNTGTIVGANTLDVTCTGMVNVAYSQSAASNLMTVSTGGPVTNVTVPSSGKTITSIAVGTPCVVTTSAAHNLVTGGVVTIAGVTDGAFSSSINGTFVPTVTGPNTFTVPVDCTTAAATGTATKLLRSKVYLKFLTQTAVGGAALPADGVYELQTNPNTSSFTVVTADTPATARAGNVIVPKIGTSYSPTTDLTDANTSTRTNAIVIFNTNVNHNMSSGDAFWVDVPIVGTPLTDAEYTIPALEYYTVPTPDVINRGVVDEDHFRIFYKPTSENGGTYPKPSGANNGVTIYPLVPPPLGRSGVVTINQSTFVLNSTEGTLSQSPLNAPTVFNFFFPDYRFPGTLSNSGTDSPEFQLTTDTNVSNLTNSVTNMFIGTGGGNSNLNGLSSFNNGGGSIVMDIGPFMLSAKTVNAGIPALVDELANLLVGAPLETATRTTIINFVGNNTNFPMTTPTPTNLQMRDRVRAIIHLITTSAEYAVQK